MHEIYYFTGAFLLALALFFIFRAKKESNYVYKPVHKNLNTQTNPVCLSVDISDFPSAKVKWVIDGDTVIVRRGSKTLKIRLDSIDCPEDGQEWGDIARFGLIKLIGKRQVKLEQHGIDDYGRTLATIYVWDYDKVDWMNVNERMVTLGHAWVMRRYYNHLSDERKDKLNRLERWAKSKKVGLWKTENPIAPWNWRNNC